METAGVVRSAPEDSGFQVGERVSAFGVLGGYAERVAVPVANVVRSRAELGDAQAVSLGWGVRTDPRSGRRHRRRSHRRPTSDDAIRVLALDGT
jgi:D-arabinose 1-dehydrogenase-like Zn-dependent alcohol dehydrogenase